MKDIKNQSLLTVQEVAEILRLSNSTIYRMIREGNLVAVKLGEKKGATIRITQKAIAHLIKERGRKNEESIMDN